MRKLTEEEIKVGFDEKEWYCLAIETTVRELSKMKTGTLCGTKGNLCFDDLVENGYGDIECRCWLCDSSGSDNYVTGMFHMKILSDKVAENLSKIVYSAGGSLCFSGDSKWEGYKEFEIE